MDKKLFVGNLAWAATEDDLKTYFGQFGTVESVEVLRDKFTGRARGFAFVVMATPEDAQNAIANTEGKEFQGRPLKVNIARPLEDRPPRERRDFGGEWRGFGDRGNDRGGFGGERRGFGGPRERRGFGGGDRRDFGDRNFGDRGNDRGGFGGGERRGFGGPRERRDFGGERRGFGDRGNDRGGFGGPRRGFGGGRNFRGNGPRNFDGPRSFENGEERRD